MLCFRYIKYGKKIFVIRNVYGKKKNDVSYLKDIKHAKGKRLIFNLPLNGQRTHTNAKTVRRLLIKNDQYRLKSCVINVYKKF